MNFVLENKYPLSYFLALIILGYFLFPVWSIMLFIWSVFYFAIIYRKENKVLDTNQNKIWKITVFAYPILETFIKFMITFDIIPFSWRWLNTLEHLAWALSMYLMLLPYTKSLQSKVVSIWALFLIAGIVIIFGNLNELFEYIIRNIILNFTTDWRQALYYTDTTIDLTMNFVGVLTGAIISLKVLKK